MSTIKPLLQAQCILPSDIWCYTHLIQHQFKIRGHIATFVYRLGNQAACICLVDIWWETDLCQSVSTFSFTSPKQTASGHHANCSDWWRGCREVSCLLIRHTSAKYPGKAMQILEVRTSLVRKDTWKNTKDTKFNERFNIRRKKRPKKSPTKNSLTLVDRVNREVDNYIINVSLMVKKFPTSIKNVSPL